MKILLTGAGGMLAADLIEVLKHELLPLTHVDLNISNEAAVLDAVATYRPELIINCAAYTKVDDCEINAPIAYAVNVQGPDYLTAAAEKHGADILHISTDYVFDGMKNAPYVEDDAVNPLSVYGCTKLEGEECVRRYARHYIVRTQWLYGLGGGNFVKTMLKLANERDEIRVVDDQTGSPTYTRDLAAAIAELITTRAYGTYHITNSDYTSWYGFTKEIFALAGIKTRLVPCTTEDFPRPAKRPVFAPLENRNWTALGKKPLRGYSEAVSEYLGVGR